MKKVVLPLIVLTSLLASCGGTNTPVTQESVEGVVEPAVTIGSKSENGGISAQGLIVQGAPGSCSATAVSNGTCKFKTDGSYYMVSNVSTKFLRYIQVNATGACGDLKITWLYSDTSTAVNYVTACSSNQTVVNAPPAFGKKVTGVKFIVQNTAGKPFTFNLTIEES